MTTAQKLKEIEMKLSEDSYYLEYEGTDDVRWLIARVKQLESALKFYNARSNIPIKEICEEYEKQGSTLQIATTYTDVARKALEGEE